MELKGSFLHRQLAAVFDTAVYTFVPLIMIMTLSTWTDRSIHSIVNEEQCYQTCRLRIVESIPDNITFANGTIPPSTFYAWNRLIERAEKEMHIAAYKTSLQGKHVLGSLSDRFAREGNSLYSSIFQAAKSGVQINMVENYPPKDKGDNSDGIILENYKAVNRRSLDLSKIMGKGKMHSKFLLSDNKHFYLGSANLDWRSLNQKMELGVLVEDCDCLGEDLKTIFGTYWNLPNKKIDPKSPLAMYNLENPLNIQIDGEKSQVYIATSPKELNNKKRTWDLAAIIHEIDSAKDFLDIHVMDYFPLFIYRNPRTHFPIIDDAIRRAIVRGVKVRILAAALHYPEIGTRFLRSLESLNQINANVSIQVKIFKVPTTMSSSILISRERRTHNKFMVSESAVVIGTSNWSGDYFVGGTTGAAIVIKQKGVRRELVSEMKNIFQRDWDSDYAHELEDYYNYCILSQSADFCEGEKDPSLFASPNHQ